MNKFTKDFHLWLLRYENHVQIAHTKHVYLSVIGEITSVSILKKFNNGITTNPTVIFVSSLDVSYYR